MPTTQKGPRDDRAALLEYTSKLVFLIGEVREMIAGEVESLEVESLDRGPGIEDAERERLRGIAEEMPDAKLVYTLLLLHKHIEQHGVVGKKPYEWAQIEAVLLSTVLDRFAPEAFEDALALYFEHEDSDEQEDDEGSGGDES